MAIVGPTPLEYQMQQQRMLLGLIQTLNEMRERKKYREAGLQQQGFENQMKEREFGETQKYHKTLGDYYQGQLNAKAAPREPDVFDKKKALADRLLAEGKISQEQYNEAMAGVSAPTAEKDPEDVAYRTTRGRNRADAEFPSGTTDKQYGWDVKLVDSALEKYNDLKKSLAKRYESSQDIGAQTMIPDEQPDIKNLSIVISQLEKTKAKLFEGKPLSESERASIKKIYSGEKTALSDPLSFWASPAATGAAPTKPTGPTATGPNGEKVVWDGKGWIPLK